MDKGLLKFLKLEELVLSANQIKEVDAINLPPTLKVKSPRLHLVSAGCCSPETLPMEGLASVAGCQGPAPGFGEGGQIPQKVQFPRDPAIPSLSICPKELKARTGILAGQWWSALPTTAKRWGQLKGPSADGWVSKMWSLHTVRCSSVIKGNDSC